MTPSATPDTQAPKPALGFIGLGLMGAPMVRRLLAAGYPVTVWNRNRDKMAALAGAGARPAETPAALAAAGAITMLCVLDTDAVEQVVFGPDGVAAGMPRGGVLVDFSSIRPEATRAFAARLRETAGAGWIDAPVSGGVGGAERGTLAIMAGGEAADIERVRPVMAAVGQRFTHMGPVGAGQTTKLCNQILVGCTLTLVAEATQLARNAGIDAARLPECLRGGSADSPVLQAWVSRMLEHRFEEGKLTEVAIFLKDLDTATALGRATRTPLPMTTTAAELFRTVAARGGAALDPAALIGLYEPTKPAT